MTSPEIRELESLYKKTCPRSTEKVELENLVISIFNYPKYNVGRVKYTWVRAAKMAKKRRWSQDQGFVPFRPIQSLMARRRTASASSSGLLFFLYTLTLPLTHGSVQTQVGEIMCSLAKKQTKHLSALFLESTTSFAV